MDPRAGASLVWGRAAAGGVANAIPRSGEVEGTLRVLDVGAWQRAGEVLAEVLEHLVAPLGVHAKLLHSRGVPPTVNEATSVHLLEHATRTELGPQAVAPTEQSLGGEDFGWYLEAIQGALARLGTRRPGRPHLRPAPRRLRARRGRDRRRRAAPGGRRARLAVGPARA